MAIRSRQEEKDVLPDYLVKLHASHENWFIQREKRDTADMVAEMLRSTLRIPGGDGAALAGAGAGMGFGPPGLAPAGGDPRLVAAVDEAIVRSQAKLIVDSLPSSIRCALRAPRRPPLCAGATSIICPDLSKSVSSRCFSVFSSRHNIVFLDSKNHKTMHDAIDVRLSLAPAPIFAVFTSASLLSRLSVPPPFPAPSQGVPALILNCDAHLDLVNDVAAKEKMATEVRPHFAVRACAVVHSLRLTASK